MESLSLRQLLFCAMVVTVLNMLSSIGHGISDWRRIFWRVIWRGADSQVKRWLN